MQSQKNRYKNPFGYKLIYVFRINDDAHKDCLKVGDTTVIYEGSPDDLTPNCRILNSAANARINGCTRTAGIHYDLLYTELAFFQRDNGKFKAFRDYTVHKVLLNSGIEKKEIQNAREWFVTDLETVKNAIKAVKDERKSLTGAEISTDKNPIVFRPSQAEAIEKTTKYFSGKAHKQFLWNAKMRFGKTLAAYEVVRLLGYEKTLIYTHRPVVLKGWREDFYKIFTDEKSPWIFGNKPNQVINSGVELKDLLASGKKFVYFASLQDLRGSKSVGGNFDKNDDVFKTDWDLVIVDEAHEGTQTGLGEEVLAQIFTKENKTKLLQLSGTPFNLITKYTADETYTWDYTNEQYAKAMWDKLYGGDSNPYADLPSMQIYTFDLAKQFAHFVDSQKAFNFREFFRVWSGDIMRDGRPVPKDSTIGRFVYEKDVEKFLNLISRADESSNFPFSKEEFRDYFRHTLWMLPGVASAKALSEMLQKHPIFGKFNIANVAGDGDEEEESKEALKKVENAIGDGPDDSYSITLSCGRLTTGVSVKEWTAVMMLSGSYSTAASQYLQTIFRVQTPAEINGRTKETCYVFDFAPDRTLKMMADAVNLSTKAGRSEENSKKAMGSLLNFCPIIAVDGTNMREYDVEEMLVQLKKAYIDRVCVNGFDDSHLYNFNLPELSEMDKEMLDHLNKIAKASGQSKKPQDLIVNKQGFDEEEHEKTGHDTSKPPREKTAEDLEKEKKKKERANLISNLRAISIRIPLLVYGANIPFEQDITIDNITDIVDDISWEEFMPKGFSKDDFKYFKKFYDTEVFIGAGKRIRQRIKDAESLPVMERVKEIAEIFATFRNPDKETVLTPWRVVNMHMSDCLGGYDFWNENHTETLDTPRVVDHGKITAETFWKLDAKFLEINSKTGLYPLYVAYSLFCALRQSNKRKTDSELWEKVLKDNVYVICKTPMAEYITNRTLAGFKKLKTNARYYPNLLKDAKENPDKLSQTICDGKEFWKEGEKNMKFDAVVGNPPYQVSDGGNKASATPIYQHFVGLAKRINPKYISMIMPARWYSGGKGLDEFRAKMLVDRTLKTLIDFSDSQECFPYVNIAGGICYFLSDRSYNGDCTVINIRNGIQTNSVRPLNQYPVLIRDNSAISIIEKVLSQNEEVMANKVFARNSFNLSSNVRGHKTIKENDVKLLSSTGTFFINKGEISDKEHILNKYKVIITYAMSGGNKPSSDGKYQILSSLMILSPNEVCTETYLILATFNTEEEAKNLQSYAKTLFFRFLLLQALSSIHITRQTFLFVPIQDFSKSWTDAELYAKYGLTQEEIDFIESMIKPME